MHSAPNSKMTSLTTGICNNDFQRSRSVMSAMWWPTRAYARARVGDMR